jgi:osmoprotectant transport system permease protein
VPLPRKPLTFDFSNPWFSWSYVTDHVHDILAATRAHVTLTLLAVGIGLAVALPLAIIARENRVLRGGVLGLADVVYSIPSLAAVVAFLPAFGLQIWTIVFPLAGYNLVILVRNILAGLDAVPGETVEAARGMGYGSGRLFWRVQLPLALPAIMAGLRIATVSTIELVVIGGYIGQNGYGRYIFQGLHDNYRAEITTYVVLTVLLALVADALILGIQRLATPWARSRA